MEIGRLADQFTRLPVVCAGIAAVIVLSLALWAAARFRKKRLVRAKAQKEARRLVGLMRKCPRLSKTKDRQLAVGFAKQLDDVVAANGFALHEVGTSRQEIDRILHLVREEVVANPRYDQPNAIRRTLNVEEPGTPGIAVNEETAADSDGEEIVFIDASVEHDMSSALESTAETVAALTVADASPEPPPSDPIRALQTLGDEEIDAFVVERFDAMTVKD